MHNPSLVIAYLCTVGLLELGLAFFFLKKYQKSTAITAFACMTIAVALWVFLNGFSLIFERTSAEYDFWARTTFIAAAFVFPFMYLFTLNYPVPKYSSFRIWFLTLISPIILSILSFSKSVIEGFEDDSFGTSKYGPVFWIFATFLFFWFVVCLVEMTIKIRSLGGQHRNVIKYLFIGVILSGVLGLTYNLILPYFFNTSPNPLFGAGATIIWLGLVTWVIRKK